MKIEKKIEMKIETQKLIKNEQNIFWPEFGGVGRLIQIARNHKIQQFVESKSLSKYI